MERSQELPRAALERLEQLALLHDLDRSHTRQLAGVLTCLAEEDAPTAVHDPVAGADVHIADSLVALDTGVLAGSRIVSDIGSGCGIPALALAVCLPAAKVYAVDSQRRRCEFIASTADFAGIGNIETVWARAEEWSEGIGICDVVAVRAVAQLSVLLEYSAPLLVPGGTLVAWKGRLDGDEMAAAGAAATELGMSQPAPVAVVPWSGGGVRQLVLSTKEEQTPERFPRRPGMAATRPLGL